MGQTTLTLNQAEAIREDAKAQIALQEALERLHDNKDFQLVFLKNYVEEEPCRLVNMLTDNSVTNEFGERRVAKRDNLYESMIGVSKFTEYMRAIPALADMARKDLDRLDEAEKAYYEAKTNPSTDEVEVITNT